MRYPIHEVYEQLYQRFFKRTPAELLEGVVLEGKHVLDLCGGGGRLSLHAINAGAARVSYVDDEPDMLTAEARTALWACNRANRIFHDQVEHVLRRWWVHDVPYDVVACQQGINYWLTPETARDVYAVLAPGGVFAFNTFNVAPPRAPKVREYTLDGHNFVEVSYLVGDTVYHVQARDGLPPHVTHFKWISPENLYALLLEAGFKTALCGGSVGTGLWQAFK